MKTVPLWLGALIAAGGAVADVEVHKVDLPGLVAGGDKNGFIYYDADALSNTTANASIPFLSFAHGMATGGDQVRTFYDDLLTKVAEAGFIVIAPKSCPLAFCGDFYKDQLYAINYAKQEGASLHPVIAKADFSRIGVFGHSMGGAATLQSAAEADENDIKAAFALNPACDMGRPNCRSSHITVPVFFATSDEDVIVLPTCVELEYNHDTVEDKILVQLKDAGHMEVTEKNNRWEPWVLAYLQCKITGDESKCASIYNSTDGICQHVKASHCKLPNGTTPLE